MAALVTATLVAYEPIRHNGFVSYDDTAYITDNPNVTGGITQASVIWAFTNSHMGNWYPLTLLSHMLDCEIFGLNPLGNHFINVLLHIASSLLLFWILAKITGAIWPSAFVAAVFAIHPLQVESVAWAAERKTVLSGFFWFLTIAVYIWYTKRPGIGRYILLFVTYALCIMTKPVVVTLPLVLLLLDYWPLERLNWKHRPAGKTEPLSRLFMEKAPFLVLSAILSAATIAAQKNAGALIPAEAIPFDSRVANMFLSYIKYIGKTIFPSRLAVFYPHSNTTFSVTVIILCALIFILITAISIFAAGKRKYITVGWLWYVGTLVPMIGLVQAGEQAIADRYMYLPIIGLLVIIGWIARDFVFNRPRLKLTISVLATIILFSSVVLTQNQIRYWQNGMVLFEHALKVTKNNHVAEKGYGSELFAAGRLDEAAAHFRNALMTHPGYLEAGNELGKIYFKQGKLNEAVACFNKILKYNKGSAEIYYNLGITLMQQKKYEESIKCFAKVLELDSKYPDAHNNMGIALLATGKKTEAIKHLNEALQTNSNDAGLYGNLGNAYVQSGTYDLAVQNWAKALKLKPNSTEILNNIAWILATVDDKSVRDANKAIEAAGRACELTANKNAEYLDTLAATYAAASRFDDAIKTAHRSLDIAKAGNQTDLAGEIEKRIKLYEAGQPYREK